MPGKTQGDKIDELQKLGATLTTRADNTDKEITAIYLAHSETARIVTDMRREHERKLALLEKEIEDIKKWKQEQKQERDEWSRRTWAFGPNLVAAIVSGIIAAAVAYFIPRR